MGIKYFGDCYSALAHLDDKMGVWRINPDEINRPDPPLLTVRAIVILTRGGLHLRNDDRSRIMSAPAYADFSASGVSLRLMSSSTDAEGYVFLFSSEFVVALFQNHPPFPRSYVSYIQSHPVCRMSPQAVSVLAADCQSVMATLLDSDNIHHADIVKSKTTILYMEIANYFEHCVLSDSNAEVEFSDRCMELFTAFVEMLRLNAKCNHDVAYYASQINITPQYLNRVVKEVSGRTPSAMVADAVLGEAKRLLDTPNLTLRQIAEEMNFADQSVFTKFFKRMTSLTPMQYRNRQ